MTLTTNGRWGPEALLDTATGRPITTGTVTVPSGYSTVFANGNLTITGPPGEVTFTVDRDGLVQTFTVQVDAAVSELAEVAGLARDALPATTASATYDPVGAAATRLRAVAIGDSTVAGEVRDTAGVVSAVGNSPVYNSPLIGNEQAGVLSWFTWACLLSGGRLLNVHNAGRSSDTSTGCLARFQADVVAFKPDVVFIAGGVHNDVTSGMATATSRANVVAMIRAARAAGIVPVLVTIYPEHLSSFRAQMRQHNAWLKNLAAGRDATYPDVKGLLVVDPYPAVVDPASTTGAWLPAYSTDGTHATAAGALVAGQKVVADLGGLLRGNTPAGPFAAVDSVQGSPNLLANGIFHADVNADGIADGWIFQGAGVTKTLETDPAILGKVQRADVASATLIMRQNPAVTPGRKYKFAGLVKADTGGSLSWNVIWTFVGASGYTVQPIPGSTNSVPWTYFECEAIAPTGATQAQVALTTSAGVGTLRVAQWSLIDMTSGLTY